MGKCHSRHVRHDQPCLIPWGFSQPDNGIGQGPIFPTQPILRAAVCVYIINLYYLYIIYFLAYSSTMKHSPPSLDTLTAISYFNKRQRHLIKDEKKIPPKLALMCPCPTQCVILISERWQNGNKEPIHSVSLSPRCHLCNLLWHPLRKSLWCPTCQNYIYKFHVSLHVSCSISLVIV